MFYDCYTALCQARGISRSRAAQEMGLSNSTVTKWKNTGATPSGETLARVSAYFGVPVGELLGEAVPSVQEERKLPEGAVPFDPTLTAPLLGSPCSETENIPLPHWTAAGGICFAPGRLVPHRCNRRSVPDIQFHFIINGPA